MDGKDQVLGTKGKRGMREMEGGKMEAQDSLSVPCPVQASTSAGHAGKRPSSRHAASRRGASARLPVTALPEQARRLLWAAPGWLLGSSSWEAF